MRVVLKVCLSIRMNLNKLKGYYIAVILNDNMWSLITISCRNLVSKLFDFSRMRQLCRLWIPNESLLQAL